MAFSLPKDPPRTQRAWDAIALLALVAIAVAVAWPVYEDARVAVVAAAGLIIGAGSVVAGWALRWRWWAIGATAVGGYLLAVVPVAIPSALSSAPRTFRGVAEGMIGIVTGWKRLLTISTPAGTYQGVLVPFLVTVIACCLAAAALMLFGRKWAALAAAPMLVMLAFGLVFGTSDPGPAVQVGPLDIPASRNVALVSAALLVVLAWLLGRARLARAAAVKAAKSRTGSVKLGSSSTIHALRRHLLAAFMVILTIAGVAAALPVAERLGKREVLREEVDPLLLIQQQQSPLSTYRQWFGPENFASELFRVSHPGLTDRLRLVTLDAYDGQTFHVSAANDALQFSRQPSLQEPHLTITIGDGFAGIWVPLSRAEGSPHFSGPRADLLADAYYASSGLNSGLVVIDTDLGSGLQAGDSFIVAAAPSPSLEALSRLNGGNPLLREEQFPALAAWVEDQGLGRTGADLIELIERLRERGYISHALTQSADSQLWLADLSAKANYTFQASRAGHSGARIEEMFAALTEQELRAGSTAPAQALIAAIGDDEQFATASALVARHLGFESRVVMGVRLGSTGEDWAVPPCSEVCQGANVTAWVEVRTPTSEWFPIDTTPQFEQLPLLVREGQTPPENPTEPEQVASDVIDPPVGLTENTSESPGDAPEVISSGSRVLEILILVATVVFGSALVFSPLAVFPLAKSLRRKWRRRVAVPEVAMVGAWQELIDTYVDHGIDVPQGLTRLETADVLERPTASVMAAVIDRAVFAEHPPTQEARNATWEMLDLERKEISSSVPLFGRIRATFTPASLVRQFRGIDPLVSPSLRRRDRRGFK